VSIGDGLVLWPGARAVRVRGLHRHETAVERIAPGSRAAVNLAGVGHHAVERGAMIGRPGDWVPTDRFLAEMRTVRELDEPMRDRGAFHLHLGTAALSARIRLVEGGTLAGKGAAVVQAASPLPLRAGDRFILRDVGRRAVVAGGRVIDPHPPRRGAAVAASLPVLRASGAGAGDVATALLEVRASDTLHRLAADSGGGLPSGAITAGDVALSRAEQDRLVAASEQVLEAFHIEFPLRPGMPKPALAGRLGVDPSVVEAIAAAHEVRLRAEGATVRLPSFSGGADPDALPGWPEARDALGAAGLAVPARRDLGLDDETVHALLRAGALVAVTDDLVYLPETLDDAMRVVAAMEGPFTVAEARDALGVTRKYAVPLLEWMDRTGVTRREGDVRTVRPSPPSG
jgi:selenocysteine-specific elongation factor